MDEVDIEEEGQNWKINYIQGYDVSKTYGHKKVLDGLSFSLIEENTINRFNREKWCRKNYFA